MRRVAISQRFSYVTCKFSKCLDLNKSLPMFHDIYFRLNLQSDYSDCCLTLFFCVCYRKLTSHHKATDCFRPDDFQSLFGRWKRSDIFIRCRCTGIFGSKLLSCNFHRKYMLRQKTFGSDDLKIPNIAVESVRVQICVIIAELQVHRVL